MLTFRVATPQDVPAVVGLVADRIGWMDRMGLHQWNETDYFGRYPQKYWEQHIDSFLLGLEEEKVVAAVALYTHDVRWEGYQPPDDERNCSAYYLHHLVTSTAHPGVGAEMMRHVERYAQAKGVSLLRLDSAVGNSKLEHFYTRLGYQPCGECHDQLYHGVLRQKKLSL